VICSQGVSEANIEAKLCISCSGVAAVICHLFPGCQQRVGGVAAEDHNAQGVSEAHNQIRAFVAVRSRLLQEVCGARCEHSKHVDRLIVRVLHGACLLQWGCSRWEGSKKQLWRYARSLEGAQPLAGNEGPLNVWVQKLETTESVSVARMLSRPIQIFGHSVTSRSGFIYLRMQEVCRFSNFCKGFSNFMSRQGRLRRELLLVG
jgi:hypothetical protein